jgi:hypothetical protein
MCFPQHSFSFPGHLSALSHEGTLLATQLAKNPDLRVLTLTSLDVFNLQAYMILSAATQRVCLQAPFSEKPAAPAWMGRVEFVQTYQKICKSNA